MKVYVVRKLGLKCPRCRAAVPIGGTHAHSDPYLAMSIFAPIILSAWPDVYGAKFEAQRWETDSKIPHDFVEGNLTLDGIVDTEEVKA